MAGSYNHVVAEDGKLLAPHPLCDMLECRSGDVYEAVEEMYGMIWWLADNFGAEMIPAQDTAELVEEARKSYRQGLEASPGINGHNPEDG